MRLFAAVVMLLSALSARAAGTLPKPLAPYAGKVVYLDFWASWCGPCAQSFPWLNQLQERYGDALTVVGVNVDTDGKLADGFLKKHPAAFAILRDPAGELPELYKIDGMPSSVILDGNGRVLHQHSGFRAEQVAEYEAAIRAALATVEARK